MSDMEKIAAQQGWYMVNGQWTQTPPAASKPVSIPAAPAPAKSTSTGYGQSAADAQAELNRMLGGGSTGTTGTSTYVPTQQEVQAQQMASQAGKNMNQATAIANQAQTAINAGTDLDTWRSYLEEQAPEQIYYGAMGLPNVSAQRNPWQQWLADQYNNMASAYAVSGMMGGYTGNFADWLGTTATPASANKYMQNVFSGGNLDQAKLKELENYLGTTGMESLMSSVLRNKYSPSLASWYAGQMPEYQRAFEATSENLQESPFTTWYLRQMGVR